MEQNLVNQKITDGNFDQSLAVKCINGTFVGKKADNIISYKGIQRPTMVSMRPITMGRLPCKRLATPLQNMEQARTVCT